MSELASALVGGLIVAASNFLLLRRRERVQRRTDLAGKLARLFAQLDALAELIQTQPRTTKPARATIGALAWTPNLESAIGRVSTRIFFPELRPLLAACRLATNEVLLTAPPQLVSLLPEIFELISEAAAPSAVWKERWDRVRAELLVASRGELGEDPLIVASAGEPVGHD